MFDFVNSTYSGALSILSTLFGLSYPLVIGCIEKIDDKFGSTKLSERFMKELFFKIFKTSLTVNLIMAVLFPFLMDGCAHARIFMGIQCVGAVVLVSSALFLFSKIIIYYNITDLQKDILADYNNAVSKKDKTKERIFFTQWSDLSGVLLKSADNVLAGSIYQVLYEYVIRVYDKNKHKELVFDLYYYEGVSRINEFLSKGETKPISVNNGNDILTSLILMDSIVSETTYRYLWRNLRIQMHYNKDEWIMEYWKMASQKMNIFIISQDSYNEESKTLTSDQIEEDKARSENFMEFHIMLCAMLIQQKKYSLLELMLSFSQSEPPSYPLVPSTLREIIDTFNRINNKSFINQSYYEEKYPMPNMHGITEGKIIGAANCYLALLAYRVYVIQWFYGHEFVLNTGILPNTLSALKKLNDHLDLFDFWLKRIENNKELLDIIEFRSFDEELKDKGLIDAQIELLKPGMLVTDMQKKVKTKMKELKETLPLSSEKIESEEGKLTKNIEVAIEPYEDLLEERFTQEKSYDLTSSISMPFHNTAFVENPDVSQVGIADCMSSYMLSKFRHSFASSFYIESRGAYYQLSSEELFEAIDKLELNGQHYIIAFDIYFDFYIGRIKNLKKESDNKYTYKGTKILVLSCRTKDFSQMLYVMRFDDRPYLCFQDPSQEEQKKLYLSRKCEKYGLWLSLEKISDHPELLKEAIKSKLGDKANENSLFTAIWKPRLSFKPGAQQMVRIKVKYRLRDEGEYDNLDKVKPFPKED